MKIRTMNRNGFRSGEWADLLTTAPAPEVRFDDGAEDFWVVGDPDGEYEFEDVPS